MNMKKVETAVANIIHNRPVVNREALINLESLDCYKELPELGLITITIKGEPHCEKEDGG
jgi:hypothetical protein